jgi:hypothetical protein
MSTLEHSRRGWGPNLARAALVFALVLATHSTARAALITPAGLLPGDTYQLVFVTSGTTAATSSDIADYDAFVQAAAAAAGMGSVAWHAIGSTLSVDARDHALVSAPVYNMNGELVATSFDDFWDGTHSAGIDFSESNAGRNTNVWTGTLESGVTGGSGAALGEARPWWGESTLATGWTEHGRQDNTVSYSLFALSAPLTVVPEPGVAWLLGLASAGLAGRGLLRRSR